MWPSACTPRLYLSTTSLSSQSDLLKIANLMMSLPSLPCLVFSRSPANKGPQSSKQFASCSNHNLFSSSLMQSLVSQLKYSFWMQCFCKCLSLLTSNRSNPSSRIPCHLSGSGERLSCASLKAFHFSVLMSRPSRIPWNLNLKGASPRVPYSLLLSLCLALLGARQCVLREGIHIHTPEPMEATSPNKMRAEGG